MRSTCTAGTTLFKVTPQLHSTKPELRFSVGSKAAHGVLEICHGENLWQFCRLKIRLNAFRRSMLPQKQFIIITRTICKICSKLTRKTSDQY